MRMKLTYEIDLDSPDETLRVNQLHHSADMALALHDISQRIFRPARRHGYSNQEVEKLLDKCGEDGVELIGRLETIFYEILEDNNLVLDKLTI